jgi:class 3 adenylate cyclase
MFVKHQSFGSVVPPALSETPAAFRRFAARRRVRELTVMFTDITGFTELAESLPPTLVARLLRSHFRLLARCIEIHDGRIDKVMGDGLIAVWERDGETGPSCNPALRSAVAMRAALRSDNEQRLRRGQPSIRLRVGIHAGPLIATPLGAAGCLGMALCGDTVNVAQRLEDAARDVQSEDAVVIVTSDAVVARAGGGFRFDELGELPVRGRREPVLAFEVMGFAETCA